MHSYLSLFVLFYRFLCTIESSIIYRIIKLNTIINLMTLPNRYLPIWLSHSASIETRKMIMWVTIIIIINGALVNIIFRLNHILQTISNNLFQILYLLLLFIDILNWFFKMFYWCFAYLMDSLDMFRIIYIHGATFFLKYIIRFWIWYIFLVLF